MAINVLVRCYGKLNSFLPTERHKQDFNVSIIATESVKGLIETLGVPHTEIDLILVNGKSVSFSHVLKAGDRISVYPAFETFDISTVTKLRKNLTPKPRHLLPDP